MIDTSTHIHIYTFAWRTIWKPIQIHLNFTAATFDTILAGHSILHSSTINPTILQSRNFIVKISYCQIYANLQLDYNRWNVWKTVFLLWQRIPTNVSAIIYCISLYPRLTGIKSWYQISCVTRYIRDARYMISSIITYINTCREDVVREMESSDCYITMFINIVVYITLLLLYY